MKKKFISGLLSLLIAGLTVACGGTGTSPQSGTGADLSRTEGTAGNGADRSGPESLKTDRSRSDESPEDSSLAEEALAKEVVNERNEYVIYCPNETLPDIFEACYPGYEPGSAPATEEDGVRKMDGKVGDMTIHWVITDYLTDLDNPGKLDRLLVSQQSKGASAYDWVDLYVVDEVNLEKYIGDGVGVATDLASIGVSRWQMRHQLPYTRTLGSKGYKQYGAAIDIAPGVFLYRRSVANAVLGSDDPETVGKAVADWETFEQTAKKAGEAGYKMLAGFDAAFDVFAESVSSGWYMENGSVHIDKKLMEWVEMTERFAKDGICGQAEIMSDEWFEGLRNKGDVFGYFLSAEEIYGMTSDFTQDNTESYGDWGVVTGPAGWYRGGIWLCAAVGSPNPGFSAEIIKNLTCDYRVMQKLYEKTGLPVNNRLVLSGKATIPADRSMSGYSAEEAPADITLASAETPLDSTRTAGTLPGSTQAAGKNQAGSSQEDVKDPDVIALTEGDNPADASLAAEVQRNSGEGSPLSVTESTGDPFLGGQLSGPVYLEAAERVRNPVADMEKWVLDDYYEEAYYPYFRGECSANDALAAFYKNAKSLIIMEDEEW